MNSVTPFHDQRDTRRARQAIFFVSVTLMAALSRKDLSIYKTTPDNIADGRDGVHHSIKTHTGNVTAQNVDQMVGKKRRKGKK